MDLYERQFVFFGDCSHAVKIYNCSPKVCKNDHSSFLHIMLPLNDFITLNSATSQIIDLRDAALQNFEIAGQSVLV